MDGGERWPVTGDGRWTVMDGVQWPVASEPRHSMQRPHPKLGTNGTSRTPDTNGSHGCPEPFNLGTSARPAQLRQARQLAAAF